MMKTNGQKSLPTIGFLTVIRDDQHGLFGGYLVLNTVGRPLEFHCTAPVRPNRAQEILYGPTLESYLYGERIGPTLLEKAKSRPVVVFTDLESVMATRQHVATPMTLVNLTSSADTASSIPDASQSTYRRFDAPHARLAAPREVLHHFALGSYHLAVDQQHRDDETALASCWSQFADHIELDEPFSRIREAIGEARRGVAG